MVDESDERTESPKPKRALLTWVGNSRGPAILIAALVAIIAIAIVSVTWWDWVRGEDSNSAALRNVGLLAAVPTSLLLAIWRNSVAQSQADTAQRQADIELQGHLNERYQKGVELLDSERMMTRIGAAYALQDLALERPRDYLTQVVDVLCAFARHPVTRQADGSEAVEHRGVEESQQALVFGANDDVVIATRAAASCASKHPEFRVHLRYRLDLRGVQLQEADLAEIDFSLADLSDAQLDEAMASEAQFSRADLTGASLDGATLYGARLDGACLEHAILSGTWLNGADLTGANLSYAIVNEAHFVPLPHRQCGPEAATLEDRPAIGVTQQQLDQARAAPTMRPHLEGLSDSVTGAAIKWNGHDAPENP